ncbi:sigma-70 family RNA polymerase sigma factor [Chitinophaga ginsengisegetis]|uniref:RNA polymerase sigma factor n=1 Tax=Chitinophaga ginsengisegetis TaxID=393003 RepID=UPI000DBAD07E|nr:sigma-70 family RNA polymerase sigma factor [Chitinophaga ginsengisegetis]MDR6565063.1 RNA polymerase sigma-70 factor (ECF subfamily) [Chitinophaga ginsengisegetis]MDR6644790.1 RNA polymerase sigma-70 factor (ECF subfamily) [Chitinophaga ginsengisegetis]MDR6652618.1 RNA polymerase sigma-70 factor (ECF subfamily) [Chitinophaga ginsengisegetis]
MDIIQTTDEKELLRRLQEGNEFAFKALYEIYAPRLTMKLLQLLRSEELAEDILQDLFIKIWEVRHSINPELSFGALVFKMAANLSKNVYRRSVYDQLMRKQINADDSHNPIEESLNQSEAKELLYAALNKLTPRQREVYTMHKIDGLSYQEISSRLNISASAINHHIQEANKQLRNILRSNYIYLFAILVPVFFEK